TPTETYTLSLHDALPIWLLLKIKGPPSTAMRAYVSAVRPSGGHDHGSNATDPARPHGWLRTQKWNTTTNFPLYSTNQAGFQESRSEEHTSELQSRGHLVC